MVQALPVRCLVTMLLGLAWLVMVQLSLVTAHLQVSVALRLCLSPTLTCRCLPPEAVPSTVKV